MRPVLASLALFAVVLGGALPAGAAGGKSGSAPANPFPTRERYVEVMHNPGHYLRDPWLRGARVATKNKRPVTYPGSMATVFKMTSKGRAVALRVFHPPDEATERMDLDQLDQRYAALTGYLNGLRAKGKLPPDLLELDYVPAAMEVDGRELPALKMPWVEGVGLDEYMEMKLRQPEGLRGQARNFRMAMRDLRAAKIAVGDLRHSNILIEPSGLPRLVDYDGIYAPPLAGMESSELGDPNYQHPAHFARTRLVRRPFDAKMDHFSSIVIYLSMHAVADDPSLWSFHDDNKLIFEHEDFKDPDNSPVFQRVLASKDPRVAKLAAELVKYAKGKPEAVPHLDEALRRAGISDDD